MTFFRSFLRRVAEPGFARVWSPTAMDPYGVLPLLAVRDRATGGRRLVKTTVHVRHRPRWRVVRQKETVTTS
jgi:hypothetical protein